MDNYALALFHRFDCVLFRAFIDLYQVYDEYENDDYDDDDDNERIKLKPDKVRVDWYPSGKQTTCNKAKVDKVAFFGHQ